MKLTPPSTFPNIKAINNNKEKTRMQIMMGVIICLLLIIISLLFAQFKQERQDQQTIESKTKYENIDKENEKRVEREIKQDINRILEEIEKNTETVKAKDLLRERDESKEGKTNKQQDDKEHNSREMERKENKFNIKVDTILKLIDNNKISEAEKQLESVIQLKSENKLIKELKNRITLIKHNLKIATQIEQALKYFDKEQWQKAITGFETILKLDPYNNLIQLRKKQAEQYSNYNNKMEHLISKPERLESKKVYQYAKKLLNTIQSEIKHDKALAIDKTPEFSKKLRQLEQLIKEASELVDVRLISDGYTEVVVYKLGKLGLIENKKIQLRPGHYTITGSRNGYKDIRKTIYVESTGENTIEIICREKI